MKTWKIIFLIAAHVVLGQLAHRVSMIATVHAYVFFGLGLFWVLRGNVPNIVYTAAYLTASEVFWRMTEAQIPWEFGKYSVGAIFALYLITRGWKKPFLPVMYFCGLLPSAIFLPMLIKNVTRVSASQISGNLSGPLLLMLSVLFFSKVFLTPLQLKKMFFYLIFPIVSILSIAGYMTYSVEGLYFSAASNSATSGGFGPNQVSSVLGLGALAAYLLLFIGNSKFIPKAILVLIAIAFATQSALTFSRSGVYTAVLSSMAATFFLVSKRKNIFGIFFAVILILGVAHLYVWPRLVGFTGGAIEKRFKQTSMTNRESLFAQDLQMFRQNLILGVGPGQSGKYRSTEMIGSAGHTEFSRMLGEHGIFGFSSLLFLLLCAYGLVRRKKTLLGQAVTVSCLSWAFLFMAVNAMRIAAPSFAFGLAAVTLVEINLQMFRQMDSLPDPVREIKA